MKIKKNLVLLGMMGSGKSTIGAIISKKLKVKFLDIDNIIEKNTNMKISEIFKKNGEDYFRNLEEKITLKSLNLSNNVISLGGGGFINDKIRKEVLTNNISFWLHLDNETLLKRIKKNEKRPIAISSSEGEINDLIKRRQKIYIKANFKINCHKLSKAEIIMKIIKLYEN